MRGPTNAMTVIGFAEAQAKKEVIALLQKEGITPTKKQLEVLVRVWLAMTRDAVEIDLLISLNRRGLSPVAL